MMMRLVIVAIHLLVLLSSSCHCQSRVYGRSSELRDAAAAINGIPHQQSTSAATCLINPKELLSLAESTSKDILQGVCNPREINDRLHNIESQMADQLNVIKTMILNIEDKLAGQDSQYRRANRKLHGAVAELTEAVQSCTGRFGAGTGSGSVELEDSASFHGSSQASNNHSSISNNNVHPSSNLKRPAQSSASIRSSTGTDAVDDEDSINPRQDEIDRYNSTIHIENGKRVFTYYWKVGDMEYKMTSWGPRRSLRSPSFYIFEYGYMMYIRLYPRQNGQNVYAHVGLTKGEYDEALEWPFVLKHRITFLDQAPPPYQDIVSRVWDPKVLCSAWNWKRPASGDNYECVGLGFPTDDLKGHNFIRDDSIVIKLTVYLD